MTNDEQIEAILGFNVHITRREREVVSRYYGLDGFRPMKVPVIARELGISRARVRQLHDSGVGRFRIAFAARDSDCAERIRGTGRVQFRAGTGVSLL